MTSELLFVRSDLYIVACHDFVRPRVIVGRYDRCVNRCLTTTTTIKTGNKRERKKKEKKRSNMYITHPVSDSFQRDKFRNHRVLMTSIYIQDRLCKVISINMQRCKCQIFVPCLWLRSDVHCVVIFSSWSNDHSVSSTILIAGEGRKNAYPCYGALGNNLIELINITRISAQSFTYISLIYVYICNILCFMTAVKEGGLTVLLPSLRSWEMIRSVADLV